MADTTFVNAVTLTDAGWFNDANTVTYKGATTTMLVGGGVGSVAVWTTATGSGSPVRATSPTLVTPTIGVATATSVNKITLTAPATGATLTLTDGKTLAATNTLTLSGTDGTTMTFPATSATLARTDAANTFTGVQTLSSQPILSTLTASLPVFSDASKGLVSNAMTGTGNVMMSASPTTTGTLTAAAITASGAITANAGLVVGASQAITGTVANSTISGFLSVAATTGTFTNVGGTLSTAAQPNVTSLGTLTGLSVSGTVITTSLLATTSAGVFSTEIRNSHASNPYGLNINYTGGAPNDASHSFLRATDTGGTKFEIFSNGSVVGAGSINIGSNSLTAGAISGTTGAFSGNITTANGASTLTTLTIGNVSSSPGSLINLAGSAVAKTWFIGANYNGAYLEITPSTATGGTTPGSPVAAFSTAGLSVTGTLGVTGLTTATGGTLFPTAGAITVSAGQGSVQGTAASGLQLLGTGNTYDVALGSYSGGLAAGVPTGTTNLQVIGTLGAGGTVSSTTWLVTAAGSTGLSSLRIPHGSAPTSPVDGDVWTTTSGLFIRINGTTKTVTLT